jgi:hypothetical protein
MHALVCDSMIVAAHMHARLLATCLTVSLCTTITAVRYGSHGVVWCAAAGAGSEEDLKKGHCSDLTSRDLHVERW